MGAKVITIFEVTGINSNSSNFTNNLSNNAGPGVQNVGNSTRVGAMIASAPTPTLAFAANRQTMDWSSVQPSQEPTDSSSV